MDHTLVQDMIAWEHWRFILVIFLLVQAVVLFLMVMAIWKKVINIETLISLLIRGRFPRYFYPEAKEKHRGEEKELEIDEETEKILEEIGWSEGTKGDKKKEALNGKGDNGNVEQ
jgi:hypothetical protein